MFRLDSFKVGGHPQLGSLEMKFAPLGGNSKVPFSSVVIGMNGTGKSFLLRTIANLFDEISHIRNSEEKRERIPYTFHIRYSVGQDTYDIVSSKMIMQLHKSIERKDVYGVYYFKNLLDSEALYNDKLSFEPIVKSKRIEVHELELPSQVIASSTQLNDRFRFKKSKEGDFYQYMGVKRSAQVASTKSFERNTAGYLYKAVQRESFNRNIEQVLVDFLDFKKHLRIRYSTKYKEVFFSGNVTRSDLDEFFNNYQDRRKTEPWGKWKYDQLIKENPERLQRILNFMNRLSSVLLPKKRSPARWFVVDLIERNIDNRDLELIEDLDDLDVLVMDSIEVIKSDKTLSLSQTSAGENHIVMSLLGILANIKNDSLVLIDEPEISLHPNWQMKYIHMLKHMFKTENGCHFIIASHSHFIVSDLEKESSSIISIKQVGKILQAESLSEPETFGWSAEQVLFDVFNVATSRNYYLNNLISDILELMANENSSNDEIKQKIRYLRSLNLNLNIEDPMAEIVEALFKKLDNA
ncbi:MAG: AAA family ATPase [Cyclobacteriaceae bacterium]